MQAENLADIFIRNITDLNIRHEFSTVSNRVTISLGIATLTPERFSSSAILMEQADQALYKAKALGKNRYCRFDT